MKKSLIILGLVLSVLLPSSILYADGGSVTFDQKKSIVKVNYKSDDYTPYKVLIEKEGGKRYSYNLYDDDEVFPLQMGSGKYTVKICKKIQGKSNTYSVVLKESKNLRLEENVVYLQSVQNINWSDKSKAIAIAKELGLNKTKSEEKFKKIYNEIVQSIVYDFQKANSVASNTRYLPVIDDTYLNKKGICYDYSSLMASMLRSIGIPTKMVHGYSQNTGAVYHAWNEVFLNNKWVVVDTTVDASLFRHGATYKAEKAKASYQTNKEF